MRNKNPFTLKKLEEISDITDDQMALLFQSTLKDFPAEVIDKFFQLPKIRNPSRNLEWATFIRLALIAMAPDECEAAKMRIEHPDLPHFSQRYITFNREEACMTLHASGITTSLLKQIATCWKISSLRIESNEWLFRYYSDPFPLKRLDIHIKNWKPCPEFPEDLGELINVLSDNIQFLCIHLSGDSLPKLDGATFTRLTALKTIELKLGELPNGIDFSKNLNLESIGLYLNGNFKNIRGIPSLKLLRTLRIYANNSSDKKSTLGINDLIRIGLKEIRLSGFHCQDEAIHGEPPPNFSLRNISGLKKINMQLQCPTRLTRSLQRSGQIEHQFEIINLDDIESISLSGDYDLLEFKQCPKLKTLDILAPKSSSLKMSELPALSIAGRAS
jgi:hypothetical protein